MCDFTRPNQLAFGQLHAFEHCLEVICGLLCEIYEIGEASRGLFTSCITAPACRLAAASRSERFNVSSAARSLSVKSINGSDPGNFAPFQLIEPTQVKVGDQLMGGWPD
jgi:hypothetical protein